MTYQGFYYIVSTEEKLRLDELVGKYQYDAGMYPWCAERRAVHELVEERI